MTSRAASTHRDLLHEAKHSQAASLQEGNAASTQLIKAVDAIVRVNSGSSQLLDKIGTIHELDREIDRQLKQDIAQNYEALMAAKARLARHVARTRRALAMSADSNESYVDLLQGRVERVDQELRILEHTLALVNANHAR
ncbi:hypothetical protein OXX69_000594 [Metschnikowia pulcherrima]